MIKQPPMSIGPIILIIFSQSAWLNGLVALSLGLLGLNFSIWPNSISHHWLLDDESLQVHTVARVQHIERLQESVVIYYQYQDPKQQSWLGSTVTETRYLDPKLKPRDSLPIIHHSKWPQLSRISWVKKGLIIRYQWLFYLALVATLWGADRWYRTTLSVHKMLYALRHGQTISAQVIDQVPLFSVFEKYRYRFNFVDAMGVNHSFEQDSRRRFTDQTDIVFTPKDSTVTRVLTDIEGIKIDGKSGWQLHVDATKLFIHGLWWLFTALALVGFIGQI